VAFPVYLVGSRNAAGVC